MNEGLVLFKDEDWYKALVGECQSIIDQRIFRSRMEIIEGKHQLGECICTDKNFRKLPGSKEANLQVLFQDIGIGRSDGYYCVKFYEKYPNLSTLVERFDSKRGELVWYKVRELLPAPKENKIELPPPKGQYKLLVVDPPWPYGTEYDADNRRVASPYNELSIEELKNFPIPAYKNSVLWLWTTHKFLWDAKTILDHWGFEYKAMLIWDKQKLGMGSWLRMQAEFCLLGIKGKPTWNLENERDILCEARREHSRKPSSFYEMVEKLTPVKAKIDIFGREKRKGWAIYGDEQNKF